MQHPIYQPAPPRMASPQLTAFYESQSFISRVVAFLFYWLSHILGLMFTILFIIVLGYFVFVGLHTAPMGPMFPK